MERKPLVYIGGDIYALPDTDTIFTTPNFSYKKIVSGKTIVIPLEQQMIIIDGIEIEGSLDIEGELCLIY